MRTYAGLRRGSLVEPIPHSVTRFSENVVVSLRRAQPNRP